MKRPDKRFLICMICLIVFGSVHAQKATRNPDVIHKLDKTMLEVFVDEVNKTDIVYKKADDPKGPLYAVPRKEVWKIVWNNGDVEEINTPDVSVIKPVKVTDLLVKKKTVSQFFWDRSGPFIGLRAGAGFSFMPASASLSSSPQTAYNGGITIGYHKKGVGIQLDALYTQLSYGVTVPSGMTSQVNSIRGYQSQLLLPLTVLASKSLHKMQLGVSVGAFGVIQNGKGGLKVSYAEKSAVSSSNCATCSDKSLGYGITGGIAATLLQGQGYAFFIDARYYYNLGNNNNYRTGESSVNAHLATLSGGILFHFPK